MGFHSFFGQKIISGGSVADPVKIRGPGFLLDSLDFYWIPWIFTGFSLDFHWWRNTWWEQFFLPKYFPEVTKDSTKKVINQQQQQQQKEE